VLGADALDVFEHRRAARADQLHGAAISHFTECDDRLDCVGGFERDV
jgi:hypothetical protein